MDFLSKQPTCDHATSSPFLWRQDRGGDERDPESEF